MTPVKTLSLKQATNKEKDYLEKLLEEKFEELKLYQKKKMEKWENSISHLVELV